MSESLTTGFLESEITDHNPEASIDRVLDEARIETSPFRNYLTAVFSEASHDKLDNLTAVLRETAGKSLEQKLAAIVPLLPESLFPRLRDLLFVLKCDISEIPEPFRQSAQSLKKIENDASSLCDPLWQKQVSSRQASLIAIHLWPEDPFRFFEFAKTYMKLDPFRWDIIFCLYGNSPHQVLFDLIESQGLEGPLNAEMWIWNAWKLIDKESRLDELFKESMCWSVDWHKRLINLCLFPLAERFEQRCSSYIPAEMDALNFKRKMLRQMEWERLSRTVPLQSIEDKKRCIELSFLTGNSFMESDCSPAVVEQLKNASIYATCWDNLDEWKILNFRVENHVSLRMESCFSAIPLHELWYSSEHKEKWTTFVAKHLDETDISRKLQILDHLLKAQEWSLGYFDANPNDGSCEWQESLYVKVQDEHWNAWHQRLMAIGEAFRAGNVRLSYKDIVFWIGIVVKHDYRSGVKRRELVPYADKALAFLRPYLDAPSEGFMIESCQLAYRILLTYAPDKLIRNLLPVVIKSDRPCCGNKLEYGAGASLQQASKNDNYPLLWWVSVMISNALRVSLAWRKRSEYIPENDVRISLSAEGINEVNLKLRTAFANFCLKNLALKKGRSCGEGRYENADCVEERPLWRQAFSNALSEIGLDLGGEVHKRLYFVKNSDPDDNVRKVAAEAYNAVRRQKHHDEEDPVKGMLIAFWWLRLAQRKSLDLDVDSAGAAKTRRNELRYASHVREVVSEIQGIASEII